MPGEYTLAPLNLYYQSNDSRCSITWRKKIWLHLPQFTKAQDTQTWRIAFARGNKSTYYPGNKYGTHTVLNSAAEIQWCLREKCSSSSCSEGPGLHHLPQGCCLFLWTSTMQFTGNIFWKTPNTHIMEKYGWTSSSFVVDFIVLALRKYLESSSLTQYFKCSKGRTLNTISSWRPGLSGPLPLYGTNILGYLSSLDPSLWETPLSEVKFYVLRGYGVIHTPAFLSLSYPTS